MNTQIGQCPVPTAVASSNPRFLVPRGAYASGAPETAIPDPDAGPDGTLASEPPQSACSRQHLRPGGAGSSPPAPPPDLLLADHNLAAKSVLAVKSGMTKIGATRQGRQTLIADLRSRIRDLEQRSGKITALPAAPGDGVGPRAEAGAQDDSISPGRPAHLPSSHCAPASASEPPAGSSDPADLPRTRAPAWALGPAWTLGDDRLDRALPAGTLDVAAVHEMKPKTPGDWPSALALALRLGVRRLAGGPEGRRPPALILWCASRAMIAEHGRLHAPGLAGLGLDAQTLIIVETKRETETLWALEEGLKSRALGLVVGCLTSVGLTPSRRLALAAAASGTPCLLLTAPCTAAAPAAATRWRIARAPSARHPFDPTAPGAARIELTLERCRGAPSSLARDPDPALRSGKSGPKSGLAFKSHVVEWCDVTHRFCLAAGLADRPVAAGNPASRPRGTALRAG